MIDHIMKCQPLTKIVPFVLGAAIMSCAIVLQQPPHADAKAKKGPHLQHHIPVKAMEMAEPEAS